MNISQVIKVVELLELEYRIEELKPNVAYLEVVLSFEEGYFGKVEDTTSCYFNPKTGLVIPKYEEKSKIKKRIKELKKELKELEEK